MTRGVFSASSQLTAAELNDCFDPPRCRLTNSANISLANNTNTALTFDTEIFDDGGMHSTSSNTSRITVPTGGAGLYLITGNIQFAANTTGTRALQIRLNGSTNIAAVLMNATTASTPRLSVTTLYSLADGDYVDLLAQQSSGGNLNVETSTENSPVFCAVWVAVS